MKKMKKMIALLVAMALVLGMSMSVMAASITISHDESYETNVDPDESEPREYSVYKIFDASYEELAGENTQDDVDDFTYEPEDAKVSYSMDSENPWVELMLSDEQTWFDVTEDANGNYVVVPNDSYSSSSDAEDFAEFLLANMPEDLDADATVVVDGDAADVDPGYYLIVANDKDSVTRLALVTTDVEMIEKNTYLGSHKETEETSYSVGDIIEYTASVSIPANNALTEEENGEYKPGHGPIILHDEMDAVLAFDADSLEAKIGENAFEDFELVASPADDCTFEIIIPVTEDVRGETITFTYSAELTSAAVDPDTGFINKWFAENNDYKTIPDEPQVYTFDFDFVKLFDDEEDDELVATFELRTDAEDEDTAIAFIIDDDGNYVKADSDDEGTTTEITMTNGTQLNFQGFAEGTYYLVELTTSTGYNLIDGPVTVTIEDTSEEDTISHSVTYIVDGEEAEGVVTVENHSGTVLPSTGGIGTTMFYVIGAILVIGAGVILVSRRRMGAR